jgi:hypothetical protein
MLKNTDIKHLYPHPATGRESATYCGSKRGLGSRENVTALYNTAVNTGVYQLENSSSSPPLLGNKNYRLMSSGGKKVKKRKGKTGGGV